MKSTSQTVRIIFGFIYLASLPVFFCLLAGWVFREKMRVDMIEEDCLENTEKLVEIETEVGRMLKDEQ